MILGVDPGHQNLGIALAHVTSTGQLLPLRLYSWNGRPVKTGPKAPRISAELMARTHRLCDELWSIAANPDITMVFVEEMSSPRGTRAANRVGMAYGTLWSVLHFCRATRVHHVSRRDVVHALGLKGRTSKEDKVTQVRQLYGAEPACRDFQSVTPKSRLEHGYDALAVLHAVRDWPEVRRLAREGPDVSQGGLRVSKMS